MNHSNPTINADVSSQLLNESYSCFDDDDGADLACSVAATEASSEEEKLRALKSSRRLVRPLVLAFILGTGLVVSVTVLVVTRRQDERLCQEAATQAAASMQLYVEDNLRTTVDTTTFTISDDCVSSWPAIASALIAACFLAAAIGFAWYDRRQQRKYDKAQQLAERTTSLVASLYPKQVRDRLLNQDKEQAPNKFNMKQSKVNRTIPAGDLDVMTSKSPSSKQQVAAKSQSIELLSSQSGDLQPPAARRTLMKRDETPLGATIDDTVEIFTSRPIADFFPDTTLLFADIAGFTAWSSARQPTEVFMLLETLYGNFDIIAEKYGIFKVETSKYAWAWGLPKTHKDSYSHVDDVVTI
ncbi:hypothetical protein MPSEU_000128100 [Mayamaea pseudoterrestris]|nr:hypothetical protein MPSEU_000128100 [Mayamaea pseudoterrestris]